MAGKGCKRRKGENIKKFNENHDLIKWPSKTKTPTKTKDEQNTTRKD